MSIEETGRRGAPSKLAGPESIRAILEEFMNGDIKAALNTAYLAGVQYGYRLASDELRRGLSDELRQGLKDVCDRALPRITDRVDHQRSGKVSPKPLTTRGERPLTKRYREHVDYVAQFPDGITAQEYSKQTGRANVGLYKLEKRGILHKRGARFYVPASPEHDHSSAEG